MNYNERKAVEMTEDVKTSGFEVDEAMKSLSLEIEKLGQLVGEVRSRLARVMSPDGGEACEAIGASYSCDLAKRIGGYSGFIQVNNDLLVNLLDRLQL